MTTPKTYKANIRLIEYTGTLAELSAIYCRLRDASGEGGSTFAAVNVRGDRNLVIGHISYNGRVWPGHATDWHGGLRPLYDNRKLSASERLEAFLKNVAVMNYDQMTAQYTEVLEAGAGADDEAGQIHYRRMLTAIEAVAQLKFDGKWVRP